MALSKEQAVEIIKKPINKARIQKAINHEDHLRFHAVVKEHTEIPVEQNACPEFPYYEKFLRYVGSFLTATDKFRTFKNLLTFPLITNELVDIISDEYGKVFDAQDSYFNVDFDNQDLKEDFQNYLDRIGNDKFWKETIFNAMLTGISSVIVCDLAPEQSSEYPEPYFYLVDIRSIIDVSVKPNKEKEEMIEYIAFNSKGKIIFLDDQFYRVFEKVNEKYILILENEHDLGYCPASFFWSDSMDKKNPILKQSPISTVLSRLNWYLYFETAKQCLDLYAAYPIYWEFESSCDYKDEEGNECINGKVRKEDGVNGSVSFVECPICSKNQLTGPGSIVQKPTPRGDAKIDGPPVGIVPIEKSSLEFNVNESERLKASIITAATGKNKLLNKQSINQDQVESQFESQTNVINWIARNLERANKWVWDTTGKLRYGNQYKGSSISYGSEFYLQSLDDAVRDYNESVNANMPSYILMSKLNVIEHLQSKNNPKERARINMLKLLEPYQLYSIKVCKDLGIDVKDKRGFVLKSNFSNFVSRFENENGSVLDFLSEKDLKTRLAKINEILNTYIDESIEPDAVQTIAERIGVGGTQALKEILADTSMTPDQKYYVLIYVFGLEEKQAKDMSGKSGVSNEKNDENNDINNDDDQNINYQNNNNNNNNNNV